MTVPRVRTFPRRCIRVILGLGLLLILGMAWCYRIPFSQRLVTACLDKVLLTGRTAWRTDPEGERLVLTQASLEAGGYHVSFEALQIRFQSVSWRGLRVNLAQVVANTVCLSALSSLEEHSEKDRVSVSWWQGIAFKLLACINCDLSQLTLQDVELRTLDGQRLRIKQLQTDLQWTAQAGLSLKQADLSGIHHEVLAQEALVQLSMEDALRSWIEELAALQRGWVQSVSLPWQKRPSWRLERVNVAEVQLSRWNAQGISEPVLYLDSLTISAKGSLSSVELEQLTLTQGLHQFSAVGHFSLLDQAPVDLQGTYAQSRSPRIGPVSWSLCGELRALLSLAVQCDLPGEAGAFLTIRPFDPRAPIALQGWAREVPWGGTAGSPVLNHLACRVQGSFSRYTWSGSLEAQGNRAERLWQAKAEGVGDTAGVEVMQYRLEGQTGSLSGHAAIQLRSTLSFEAYGESDDLEITLQDHSIFGLTGAVRLFGHASGAGRLWGLIVDRPMEGYLDGQPLGLVGSVTYGDAGLCGQNFALSFGPNTLTVDGAVREDSELNLQVDARDLALWGMRGTFSAQGRLSGNLKAPRWSLAGHIAQLSGFGLEIEQLTLQSACVGVEAPGALTLQGQRVTWKDYNIRHFAVTGQGALHESEFEWRSAGVHYENQLRFKVFADPALHRYRLLMEAASGMFAGIDWSLGSAWEIAYRPDEAAWVSTAVTCNVGRGQCALTTLQVSSTGQRGCLAGQWQDLEGRVLSELALGPVHLAGALSGEGRWVWGEAALPAVNHLTLHTEAVDVQLAAGPVWVGSAFSAVTVSLTAREGALRASLQAASQLAGGKLMAELTLTQDGTFLSPSTLSLSQLPLYLRMSTDPLDTRDPPTGLLGGAVHLTGTLGWIEPQGLLCLRQLFSPQGLLPISFHAGVVAVDCRKSSLAFCAELSSTPSTLSLGGRWRPTLGQSQSPGGGTLRCRSDGIEVDGDLSLLNLGVLGHVNATLQPELRCRWSDAHLTVLGDLACVSGQLSVNLDFGAVDNAVSTDETLVNAPEVARAEAPPLVASDRTQELDLKLTIGPAMTVDAFKVKALIGGQLRCLSGQTSALELHGLLEVLNTYGNSLVPAEYSEYGQKLLLRQGSLRFVGPVTPQVELEAIRNPRTTQGNVIAGLRLHGDLNRWDLSFFSDPMTDPIDVLSYLLSGQSAYRFDTTSQRGGFDAKFVLPDQIVKAFGQYTYQVLQAEVLHQLPSWVRVLPPTFGYSSDGVLISLSAALFDQWIVGYRATVEAQSSLNAKNKALFVQFVPTRWLSIDGAFPFDGQYVPEGYLVLKYER